MEIKFCEDELRGVALTFQDVQEGQFFVNKQGSLCQKVNNKSYHVIAMSDGKPWPQRVLLDMDYFKVVRRILPHTDKINF